MCVSEGGGGWVEGRRAVREGGRRGVCVCEQLGYQTGRVSALGRYSSVAPRPLMFYSPNETNR